MNTELIFYRCTISPVVKVLPKLLLKIYASGAKTIVVCQNEAQLNELDELLWTFSTKEFLPHSTFKDKDASLQPILLSLNAEGINSASVLVNLTTEVFATSGFSKVLSVFYGDEQEKEVAIPLKLYGQYKMEGKQPLLWVQGADGQWKSA